MTKAIPHILVLGGNFAGLGVAQKVREYAGDAARITVMDRKSYLLFIPNIPGDVFEGRDPSERQRMDLVEVLAKDDIEFLHAEVTGVDVDAQMQDLLLIEQAYAANARVIEIASQMIDRLMEI